MSKCVLVTGASSGFGQATARLFCREGWLVAGFARRVERLERLREELGSAFLPVCVDVRSKDAVERAVAALPPAWAEPEVLVNNAGLALGKEPAQSADPAAWQTMVETNINGLLHVTQAVLPGLLARNRGLIVNLSSITAHYPYPGSNVYGATKAFVSEFSKALRTDLLGSKVRVTSLEPGLARSEFSLVRFGGDQNRADAMYSGVEPIEPEDIANIIYWLATLPEHLNVNQLELMPVCQAPANPEVRRNPD